MFSRNHHDRVRKVKLSETSRLRVAVGTVCGTLFCVAAAVFADSFNFAEMSPELFRRALATDILLPTLVGGPFFFFLLEKIRQLAVARAELQKLASTDSLTAVLNRGAFVMLVEAYLAKIEAEERVEAGALLIVDADYFKAINDTHGHQAGDHALKLIAGTIQRRLSAVDLVGRIGGEEFCVFLPRTREDEARVVAEDIRQQVHTLHFPGNNGSGRLTVSVGGVSFSKRVTYKDVFAMADRLLYEAKAAGRNRVCLRSFPDVGM